MGVPGFFARVQQSTPASLQWCDSSPAAQLARRRSKASSWQRFAGDNANNATARHFILAAQPTTPSAPPPMTCGRSNVRELGSIQVSRRVPAVPALDTHARVASRNVCSEPSVGAAGERASRWYSFLPSERPCDALGCPWTRSLVHRREAHSRGDTHTHTHTHTHTRYSTHGTTGAHHEGWARPLSARRPACRCRWRWWGMGRSRRPTGSAGRQR